MIRVLVAHTFELDDTDAAVSEVLAQLDLDNTLRKHAVGLVACHADFLYEGVVKALSEALPFDLVGITTLGSSINGSLGVDILTLSVLTSDESSFSTALTTSLMEDQRKPVADAYAEAADRLPETPSFVLVYGPFLEEPGADAYIVEMNRLCAGVPMFGSVACDHNIDFRDAHVFRNGDYARDALAMVLVSGPDLPKFFFVSISEDNIPKQKGIISSSAGNVIRTINSMPAMEYLRSIGVSASQFGESGIIPMMVDYMDGAPPIGRGIYNTKDNGNVVCSGDVPENGAIAPAFLDADEVARSAKEILDKVAQEKDVSGMLVISCLSRSLVLGGEPLREAELVDNAVGTFVPCHLLYSGGEICPIYTKNGKPANRFHNFSFTVCLF